MADLEIKKATILLGLALLFSGCTSTLHFPKPHADVVHPHPKTIYVTNPEQKREYEILKSSGLYKISETDDPQLPHLTLKPMRGGIGCGNPLIVSAMTLGILPVTLPSGIWFRYEVKEDGIKTSYSHLIRASERFSIWEHFIIQNRNAQIAKALKNTEKTRS